MTGKRVWLGGWILAGITLGSWNCCRALDPVVAVISSPTPLPTTTCKAPSPIPTAPATGFYMDGYAKELTGWIDCNLKVSFNGNPDFSVSATLIGPGLVSGFFPYGTYGSLALYSANLVGGSFQGGQDYVLNINRPTGSFSVTLQAPGRPIFSPDLSTVTWVPEGNMDGVNILDSTSEECLFDSSGVTEDLRSPFEIPQIPLVDPLVMSFSAITQRTTGAIPWAVPPSKFSISRIEYGAY